jgi:hypothetical protein
MNFRVVVALLTLAGLALYTAGLLAEEKPGPPITSRSNQNPIYQEEVGR